MSAHDDAMVHKRHSTTISKLFGDPRWTDLKICCNGHSWKVHRNIVCSQCTIFEKAVDGRFVEATAGVITLPDDDEYAVQALLEYYYCGGYQYQEMINLAGGVETNPWSRLAFAVVVHTIADKYDALPLVELANAEFRELLPKEWRSRDFVEAVETIYAGSPSTKPEMRYRAVDILINNYNKFKDGEAFENSEAVFKCADFVTDVLHRKMEDRAVFDGYVLYNCVMCAKSAMVQTQEKEKDKIVERYCSHCGTRLPEHSRIGLLRAIVRKRLAATDADERG
ncbi:hypothetical protein BST61_g8246 [Cercospora zeina]